MPSSLLSERVSANALIGTPWVRLVGAAAAVLLVIGPAYAHHDEVLTLDVVLELDPDEAQPNVGPEDLLQVCSTALGKKGSYPTQVVAKLLLLRACANAQLANYESAKDDAKEALLLAPDSEPAARIHALCLQQLGAAEQAHEEIEALENKYPRSADVQNALGEMLSAEGKDGDAMAAYSKAIALDARYAPAYFNRAQAKLNGEDYDGCIRDMNRFLELSPLLGPKYQEKPYLILGRAYRRLNQIRHALRCYEMARRLNPASFDAAYGMWLQQYDLGRFATTYALATTLIRIDEKRPVAYVAMASSANKTGRHQQAFEVANRGIALNPTRMELLAELHDQLAEAGGPLHRYDLAIKEYERAFQLNPALIRALTGEAYLLATCPEEKYRDGPKARKLATKACEETDYKGDEPLQALAAAEAECGNFKEAVRLQKQALGFLNASFQHTKVEYEKILDLYEKGRPYRGEFAAKEENND